MIKRNIQFKYIYYLVAVLVCFAVYKIYDDVLGENVTRNNVVLYVHTGKGYDYFLNNLKKQNFLNNIVGFNRLAKVMKLESNLHPGRYVFEKGMNSLDLIRMIKAGNQQPINITFKYAERKEELPRIFARQLELDSNYFNDLLNDTATYTKFGFDANNIISLFIPNTYNFYWNTNASQLMQRMKKEYDRFWNKDRMTKAYLVHLSPQQVATLASIVQKESNKADEMPVIAGVYLNRMRRGIPLQADPTVLYSWNDKSIRRVLTLHTAIESPYNTYKYAGLPPGPICAASIQAIDAVLNAVKHDYLYFCAKEDLSGYHNFAVSLVQHNQNALRYQRELNNRKIY